MPSLSAARAACRSISGARSAARLADADAGHPHWRAEVFQPQRQPGRSHAGADRDEHRMGRRRCLSELSMQFLGRVDIGRRLRRSP